MIPANPKIANDCAGDPGNPCEFRSIGPFPDVSGKVGQIEVQRCRRCGHGITTPPLKDVTFLYASRQSQDYQPNAKGVSAAIKDAAFRLQALKLLRQLPHVPQRVLDFGCGSGQFTRVFGELLTDGLVVGSDFHETPPSGLQGHPYKPMNELNEEVDRFDLVMAIHVLEHDDDPHGLLSRIATFAKSGGTVVVEVPYVDCFWSKVFGRKWDSWYVPYHRTHFTRASLKRRIEAIGLQVIALHDVTVPTMGRTAANLFGSKNNLLWLLVGIAVHPIQWLGEKLSGKPTAIRAIAIK